VTPPTEERAKKRFENNMRYSNDQCCFYFLVESNLNVKPRKHFSKTAS